MKLKKIREELEKTEKESAELQKKLDKLKAMERKQVILPILKKMKGLCFRTRNSYGGDSKGWWLYGKILRNDEEGNLYVERFERTELDKVEFEYRKELTYYTVPFRDWQKIPASQYDAEKNKLLIYIQGKGK